jgi:hypothetical protein
MRGRDDGNRLALTRGIVSKAVEHG